MQAGWDDAAERRGGRPKRVLVAEESSQVRVFVAQLLAELGFRAALAADAEDALERLAREAGPLHSIVASMTLPAEGGLAFAEQVARLHPSIPIILTGEPELRAEVEAAGFGFLAKPFSTDELARLLGTRR